MLLGTEAFLIAATIEMSVGRDQCHTTRSQIPPEARCLRGNLQLLPAALHIATAVVAT